MNFDSIFDDIMNECDLAPVLYLKHHKQWREQNYPNVPVIHFTDYQNHKTWMNEKRKQTIRNIHNSLVLAKLKEQD